MNKNVYNFILIKIIIFLFGNVYSTVVIKFRGNNLLESFNTYSDLKLNNHINDFILASLTNDFYALLKIGSPSKEVIVNLSPNKTEFTFNKEICENLRNNKYFKENYLSKNNLYKPLESNTFINQTKDTSLMVLNGDYYSLATEKINIVNYIDCLFDKKCDKKEIGKELILSDVNYMFKVENYDDTILCGVIGLSLPPSPFYYNNGVRFIDQLKKNHWNEDHFYWSFNYTDFNKGFLNIGNLPFKDNKDYFEIYSKIDNIYSIVKWSIELNQLYIVNNNINIVIEENKKQNIALFNFNSYFIKGSIFYKEIISKNFFEELIKKNICKEESTTIDNYLYNVYVCEKLNKKTKLKFPNLFIENNDLKYVFKLTYDDLFIELNNKLFFLIIFRTNINKNDNIYSNNEDDIYNWHLGIPFLKKYQAFINPESKRIGFYLNNNRNDEHNENNNKTHNGIRLLIEISICIGLIIIAVYLTRKIYYQRKKKANELNDDDFEYSSDKINLNPVNNEEGKNKKSLLIEMNHQ